MPSRQQRTQCELLPHVDVGSEERSASVAATFCEIIWITADGWVLGISVVIYHDILECVVLDHLVAYV